MMKYHICSLAFPKYKSTYAARKAYGWFSYNREQIFYSKFHTLKDMTQWSTSSTSIVSRRCRYRTSIYTGAHYENR